MTILPVSPIPAAARADFEDCTVTAVSPLRIKRDADTTEMGFTPDTLVNTAFLTIGDRVRVDISRNPMLILGRADGLQNVVTVSQLPNANLLRNGTFRTNQRAYVSGTDLTLNAYGFDGWKATTANSRMTFTAAPQGQMVTVPSGDSWGQVIERADIDAGAHTVSHAGTAQVRIYNVGATPPAYAIAPVTATLDGTTDVIVEFGPGTVDKAKVERGSVATPFELDAINTEITRCRRHYRRIGPYAAIDKIIGLGWATGSANFATAVTFDPPMRATPTMILSGAASLFGVRTGTGVTPSAISLSGTSTQDVASIDATGSYTAGQGGALRTANTSAWVAFSAEL